MELLAIETAVGLQATGLVVHAVPSLEEALRFAGDGGSIRLILIAASLLRDVTPQRLSPLRGKFDSARVAAVGPVSEAEARVWLLDGLDGVLSHRLAPERFCDAVRFILAGNRFVDPAILDPPGRVPGQWGKQGGIVSLLNGFPVPLLLLQDGRIVYANDRAVTDLLDRKVAQEQDRFSAFLVAEQQEAAEAAIGRSGAAAPEPMLLSFTSAQGPPRVVKTLWERHSLFGSRGLSCVGIDVTDLLSPCAGRAVQVGGAAAEAPADEEQANGASAGGILALTTRQRQVLDLLAEGQTNKQIAVRLNISDATVKLHVHHILRGLGLSNRTAAAVAMRDLLGSK